MCRENLCPRAGVSVAEKLDDGVRSHQVLARESGTVVEGVVIRRDAGLIHKSA